MTAVPASRRHHAVYIVLDVSQSMWMPLPGSKAHDPSTYGDVFCTMLAELAAELSRTATVATTTWLSIVTFSDNAQVLLPMYPLFESNPVPTPPRGGATNYVAALDFLVGRFDVDKRRMTSTAHPANVGYDDVRVARPLMFFITDGAPWADNAYQPPERWLGSRQRLIDPPVGARIATFGLANAERRTLWELATGDDALRARNAFIASADGSNGDQAHMLAGAVRKAIADSIRGSVPSGRLVLDVPLGMKRVKPNL